MLVSTFDGKTIMLDIEIPRSILTITNPFGLTDNVRSSLMVNNMKTVARKLVDNNIRRPRFGVWCVLQGSCWRGTSAEELKIENILYVLGVRI